MTKVQSTINLVLKVVAIGMSIPCLILVTLDIGSLEISVTLLQIGLLSLAFAYLSECEQRASGFEQKNSGFILAWAVVSFIFYLWKQEDNPETRTGQQIKSYFSSRSVLSWVWRFVLVWILFYILTMIISIVALPFTGKYLVDPLNTLGMVVPDMGTLFAITQFRSLIYMLVTLPLIIFWINATWFICGETAKMHLKAFEGSPAPSPIEVMVFLVLGWLFVLFGEYKAMQLKQSNVDSDPAARGKPMKGSIPQFDG